MKKLMVVLLLLCLVAPILSNYTWLKYQKFKLRKEIKKNLLDGMDKNALVLLKFASDESSTLLEWEHVEEFKYKDQMYDVIDSKVMGDSIYYWCWPDKKETRLNREIEKELVNAFAKNPQQKSNQLMVIKLFKSLYCSDIFNWKSIISLRKTNLYPYFFYLNSIFIQPAIPPPEYHA